MRHAKALNLSAGAAGLMTVAGALMTGQSWSDALIVLGVGLALLAGNIPRDAPAPSSARSMGERSGVLFLLLCALFLLVPAGGCGHRPPPPPSHVLTTVEIAGTEIDAVTRWEVCASPRVCAFVDVGLLWGAEDRLVCIELPEYGLLVCEDVSRVSTALEEVPNEH